MGGYGTGRPSYKEKVNECRSLDVNHLNHEGCLRPGRHGSWIWSRDDEELGRIGYRAEQGRFVLDYKVRLSGKRTA